MKAVNELTYKEAMEELQGIVEQLRQPGQDIIDVDDLLTEVNRAKELLHFCGQKISHADAEIKNVLEEIKIEKSPVAEPQEERDEDDGSASFGEHTSPTTEPRVTPAEEDIPF